METSVLNVFVISWLLCNAHNSVSSSWLSPEKRVSPYCCGSSTTGSPVTCWPSTSHGLTTIRIFIMQVLLSCLHLYLWTNHHPDICADLIFIFIFILWLTANLIFNHARQEFTHYFVHILLCYAMLTSLTSRRWTENKPRLGSPYSRHHSWLWQVLFSQ